MDERLLRLEPPPPLKPDIPLRPCERWPVVPATELRELRELKDPLDDRPAEVAPPELREDEVLEDEEYPPLFVELFVLLGRPRAAADVPIPDESALMPLDWPNELVSPNPDWLCPPPLKLPTSEPPKGLPELDPPEEPNDDPPEEPLDEPPPNWENTGDTASAATNPAISTEVRFMIPLRKRTTTILVSGRDENPPPEQKKVPKSAELSFLSGL